MFERSYSVSNAVVDGRSIPFVPGGSSLASAWQIGWGSGQGPRAQDPRGDLSIFAVACGYLLAWAATVASATQLRGSLSRCCINQARLRTPKPLRGFLARNSRRYVACELIRCT